MELCKIQTNVLGWTRDVMVNINVLMVMMSGSVMSYVLHLVHVMVFPIHAKTRTSLACLLNLVSNAIDACALDDNVDKKHEVRVLTALEGETTMRFEVSDNGSGMSDSVKAKLFSSFFSTKGAKGTGLGLLVTRKLIEEHHGSIDVISHLNQGTTFIMKLSFKPKES